MICANFKSLPFGSSWNIQSLYYKHIVIEDVFSHVFSLLYCRRYIIDRKNIFIKNKILSSNPVDIVAKSITNFKMEK